jgi:integrase
LVTSASGRFATMMTPPQLEGACHGNQPASEPLEQGHHRWPESAAQAQGSLGYPYAPSTGSARSELAIFNLGVDSKLRACDLVRLRVRDICHGDRVASRAIVMQQKTHRPVQFEITEPTREALAAWIKTSALRSDDWLFAGRKEVAHLSTRQYARIVRGWIVELGTDPSAYGTHSIRRTKAS